MAFFDRVLIANRGEIAVRIIRACQELGIRTVAVYSEVDRTSLHVRLADQAALIGPVPSSESYLSTEKIISAALETGSNAIHPGYGFLAENPEFAQEVIDNGLVFIGPGPNAIRAMGDKVAARKIMQNRGVPIVPGYQDSDDDDSLSRAADDIGYPVMIKAAAGGGGKAMRIVASPNQLLEELAAARREAVNAFGDARLFLEKYIKDARHIEFQVLADHFGKTIHLFERECSIQRRHQKIIEETPSPILDEELRDLMGDAAVEAARAVGYENAGTVEFIMGPETREFYFLEMNTRLQVEHPVTEETTGIDLVQWQARIAAGEALPFSQSQLARNGCAIECRVYAEDAANQFLPSTGHLFQVLEPRRPGVRVDSGISSGDQVTVHYDPLLAKVIAHAETRAAAIQKMQAALEEFVILGATTNIEFLQAVLAHPEFQAGNATTSFIERHMSDWKGEDRVPIHALAAAVLFEMKSLDAANQKVATSANDDPYSPWKRTDLLRHLDSNSSPPPSAHRTTT